MNLMLNEAVEQEDKLCNDVETVRVLTSSGDWVSAGGRCEAAMTARTKYWWVKLMDCGELLYGKRFPPKQKGLV